jgi:hypothetical protein
MRDKSMIRTVDVAGMEPRPATPEDRVDEDWLWMVAGDPAFYLGEADGGPSRGRD